MNDFKKKKRNKEFLKIKDEFITAILSDVPNDKAFDYIPWRIGQLSTSFQLNPDESCYQIKPALLEMLEKGVTKEAILDVIRVAKAETLNNAFRLIENSIVYNQKGKKWALYFLDKEGNPKYEVVEDDLSPDFLGDEFLPRKKRKSSNIK